MAESEQKNISIHALREEGDADHREAVQEAQEISIHALREEGDHRTDRGSGGRTDFYPRPPRGGRLRAGCMAAGPQRFLSTPSARRATSGTSSRSCAGKYFYPRPPRGGRPMFHGASPCSGSISIHALREEGDCRPSIHLRQLCGFLSTPSARRATLQPTSCTRSTTDFYPRPPRGGRRFRLCPILWWQVNFYPRPPRGGRPFASTASVKVSVFLSTPSARRATLRLHP